MAQKRQEKMDNKFCFYKNRQREKKESLLRAGKKFEKGGYAAGRQKAILSGLLLDITESGDSANVTSRHTLHFDRR